MPGIESGYSPNNPNNDRDVVMSRLAAERPHLATAAYNTGEHLEGETYVYDNISEAKAYLSDREQSRFNDMVYMYGEPPVGHKYKVKTEGEVYIMVDSMDDRIAYAASRNIKLLEPYLSGQAA